MLVDSPSSRWSSNNQSETARFPLQHLAAKLVIRQKWQVKTPPPVLTRPDLFVWMAVEFREEAEGLIKALAAPLHG